MFRNLFRRKNNQQTSIINDELDYERLPVLSAAELISFTEQQNRIRSIKRIIKIDDMRFKLLYLDVIYTFAELVQLMPASQAHHHAVPGGLFIHTLEVIEEAISLRQQYKLPAFAEQEVQERERHVWTYAVFAAAILHDIGKRVTLCNFLVDNTIYSAYDNCLPTTPHKNYKIGFNETKYHHIHEQIGLTFIDIFPQIGRKFLFSHLHVVKEMIAYIHGDKFNAGMIGEIIRKADQKSTGQSLAHTPTRKFQGATVENIGERLMTQLRLMIASNDFIVNKPNANIYTKNGYTYCVSKVIVDNIREELIKNNEVDIPRDNNRIFDIFQEYGFVEVNHYTGKSIHYISIYHHGNQRVFTVLKFLTAKLFQVIPTDFDGEIEEVKDRESATKKVVSEAIVLNSEQNADEKPQKNINAETSDDPFTTHPDTTHPEPDAENLNNCNEAEIIKVESSVTNNSSTDVFAKTSESQTETPKPETKEEKTEVKSASKSLAKEFLQWCHKNIVDKSIIINESNSVIQKVAYNGESVIAVVTPRIFILYAQENDMPNPKDKSTFTKIQSAIHKEKLNIKAPYGQIHNYKIKKSLNNPVNDNIKIRHYLFTVENFCGDDSHIKEIILRLTDNTNLIKA